MGPRVEKRLKLIEGILVIMTRQIKVVEPVMSNLPIIPNILVEVSTATDWPRDEMVIPVPSAAELQNDRPDIAIMM